jgi:cytoskeletal protein RodZ
MKIGEPTKIKNSFPARNEYIKWITHKFCKWGIRLPNTKTRGTLGSPAPLWMNMSEKKYKLCFIINLTSSLTFIIFFIIVIVYNASVQASINNETTSEAETDTSTDTTTDSNSETTTDTTNTETQTGTNNKFAYFHHQNLHRNAQTDSGTDTNTETNTDAEADSNTETGTTSVDAECLNLIQQEINPQFIIIGSIILFINGMNLKITFTFSNYVQIYA